jgi:hypothetical protein
MYGRFACVGLAIDVMLPCQQPLESLILRRHVRMGAQVIAKGNRPDPLRCAHRNEVEVVCSPFGRGLAEPVFEFR